MTPDGLLLLAAYGFACYVLGLLTGARLIPWLVDRGWFPIHLYPQGGDMGARGPRRHSRARPSFAILVTLTLMESTQV
jgi:hypothetical protein